ncbi:MAG: thiamine pyrophosphate-binding protein [Protaetiibacter sp.]
MADPPSVRGADLLVQLLIDAGVESIFGVPGDTGVVFYDALHGRTGEIRHVLARDERHAAKMADAYARVTNRVGVVEVSSGGGTTFVVGGLGEAYASGIPVLLLTSDIHASSRGSGALTEIDQVALFSAVTKWCTVVESASDLRGAVASAIEAATSGRPAPVAVIIPENVFDEVLERPAEAEPPMARVDVMPRARPRADELAVGRAARLFSEATAPAILAGSGVHTSEAWQVLAELAEKTGAPVATTIHGKGALVSEHPWHLGVVGNNGGRDYANRELAEADVVLLVGTRANATDTNSWSGPARTGTPVIQIDIDPARAGRNFPEAIGLVGDARTVLGQLLDAVAETPAHARESRRRRIAAERAEWALRGPGGLAEVAEGELVPQDVIRCVNELVGSEVVVVADPGTPTPNVASYWDTQVPGRRIVIPRGHGPMGYAIPAAVGVAVARPGEPVVSFTADGSFAMACGELETVARFRLPILYVQFTNNSMGWIKMLQHLYEGGRYFGVDPGPIDAVMVAAACGIEGSRPRSLDELSTAVASFAADPRPMYLDIQVPHMIRYTPPVPAWIDALSGTPGRPIY